jgi:hypothetical protein
MRWNYATTEAKIYNIRLRRLVVENAADCVLTWNYPVDLPFNSCAGTTCTKGVELNISYANISCTAYLRKIKEVQQLLSRSNLKKREILNPERQMTLSLLLALKDRSNF